MILRAPFGAPGRDVAARTLRAPKLHLDEHGIAFCAALLGLALAGEVLVLVLRPILLTDDAELPCAS